LEKLEGLLSQGQQVDLDVYGRICGQLRRILESLGLKREAKDVAPDLKAYIAQNERERR
jgi:hypothetical protein